MSAAMALISPSSVSRHLSRARAGGPSPGASQYGKPVMNVAYFEPKVKKSLMKPGFASTKEVPSSVESMIYEEKSLISVDRDAVIDSAGESERTVTSALRSHCA